ncbi:hypothetical protein EN784_52670, partial [bacterium M00.F.Ca.ET.141.01.1.1]
SNYPFNIFGHGWEEGFDPQTWSKEIRGDTIVGNDIWIGMDAVIMPGVRIGHGAKRMQVFLAGHCQKESDRLGLGLRFMALSPARIMPGTGVGDRGIDSIAAYMGVRPADFLASLSDMQTPADVARAVVQLATGKPQGSSFT